MKLAEVEFINQHNSSLYFVVTFTSDDGEKVIKLTRQKEPFVAIQPGRVGMYVCGMTVQDRPHIGHFRSFMSADIMRRYLEYRGYVVKHVQNFTDIDDKIIARAQKEGVNYSVILTAAQKKESHQ